MIDYRPDRARHREDLQPREKHHYTETHVNNGVYQGLVQDLVYLLPQSGVVMDDVVVDRFKERQAAGEIIINPMRRHLDVWTVMPLTEVFVLRDGTNVSEFHVKDMVSKLCASVPFPTMPEIPAWKRQAAFDEAVSRVYSKAYSSSADLLIDIFQIKQTIRMLVSAGKRITAAAKAGRGILDPALLPPQQRQRIVDAYGVGLDVRLAQLSGLWCELRFGWGPLLRTLDSIVEVLIDSTPDREKRRLTYRASEDLRQQEVSATTIQVAPQTGMVWNRTYTSSIDQTVNFRAGVILDTQYSALAELGLTWQAIPIAMWDIVPWSFIVDRFINVSNFIRSLIPKQGTKVVGSPWVVIRDDGTRTWEAHFHYSNTPQGIQPDCVDRLVQSWSYTERLRVSGPPIAPVIRHDWNTINSLTNTIDGIALAIQRFVPVLRRGR